MDVGFTKWVATRGALGGIARSLYAQSEMEKKANPRVPESVIARELFFFRYHPRRLVSPTKKEAARLKVLLAGDPPLDNLRDVCCAIAEVEMGTFDERQYDIVVEVIDDELKRLGYKREEVPE